MHQLRTLGKSVIFAEVALCWLFAFGAAGLLAFGYLGSAEGPRPNTFNYVLAASSALSACLFYFAAGHLEKTSRFSPLHHAAPIAVILIVLLGGRVAA